MRSKGGVGAIIIHSKWGDSMHMHRRRKMFFLMGAGQNIPNAKAVCGQIESLHRANFMGAAAPMVPTPMIWADPGGVNGSFRSFKIGTLCVGVYVGAGPAGPVLAGLCTLRI